MSNVMEWLVTGALVVVVLVATYSVTGYGSRRRVQQDFKTPEDILTAANVYAKYGRIKAAIDLLRQGLQKHPRHRELRAKLTELTDGET